MALISGRRLFEDGVYSRTALIRGRCLFEEGSYSRAALIRERHLFEGGVYLREHLFEDVNVNFVINVLRYVLLILIAA